MVVPVSDVDRAKDFYQALGWRLDVGFVARPEFRVIQMTGESDGQMKGEGEAGGHERL